MSANDPDPESEAGTDAEITAEDGVEPPAETTTGTDGDHDDDRYASFTTESGVVIYDKRNTSAWIQSDGAVDVEAAA